MARDHARVMCAIWSDPQFLALSARAQRMYLLLLSQPKLSLCGVVDFTPGRWQSLAAGETLEDVHAAVEELSAHRFVIVDDKAQEVLLRSFVRHDGILDSPNLVQAMWKAWTGTYSVLLRAAVVDELPDIAFEVGFGSSKKDYEAPREALQMRQAEPSSNPSANPSANSEPNPSATPVPSPSPGTHSFGASEPLGLAAVPDESDGGRKRPQRRQAIPEDWEPHEHHIEFADEHDLDLKHEVAQFRDHHEAKGSVMKNWDKAFWTWLRNAEKWSHGSSRANGAGATQAWERIVQALQRGQRPTFDDRTEAVIRALGGWQALRVSANPVADRAHFLRFFEGAA